MKIAKPKTSPTLEWLTPRQCGELVQMNERTIIDHIKKNKIPALKMGREYRIPVSFLEQFKQLHSLPTAESVLSVLSRTKRDDAQPPKTT